ncbi:daptomycin-sensing surface protein LiaX [Lacticaseibacillus parakribbianus]|uniref:daptomycin-sensing surface protein LiaX n=1 Tax=Lacticaseibacillus parakribbianus TaxID=2970927 RepID=UPI0021CAFC1F|nr:daptomycin-sensing surface protein LiaX [Lacticaseibacillus parakribbianus]
MNERERILDLVKQGVITSEEALVLLENLAKAKAKTPTAAPVDPATDQTNATHPTEDPADTNENDTAEDTHQETPAEEALALLNTQLAELAGNLDAAQAQVKSVNAKLAANAEQIIVLDTMEDLDTLSEEKYKERGRLKQENLTLTTKQGELATQVADLKAQIAELNRQKHQLTKKTFAEKVLPDDWQDQAKDALTDIGKTVNDATSQIGSLVKKTMNNVLDNVDWKDVTVRVPGIATERFSHTFDFADSQATILDLKVANGDITIDAWDQAGIQVNAEIKLFGKMQADTPLQAFLDRSHIEANDDHLVFQVPNRRVQADLTIHLPKRDYDHVAVRLLNGGLILNGLNGKDFYVKSTNGELTFNQLTAVMLEIEGVNGSIKVTDGTVHDLMLETVNGDIKVSSAAKTLALQTVNGTIRTTLTSDFTQLTASSVNGNVKIALPASVAVAGEARTRFGGVKSRMSGISVSGKAKSVSLDRPGTGVGKLKVTTTSGNVQLKDTDND